MCHTDTMRKLPPLNAIKSFESAARHLNCTRAAEELNVTPGAVSRAIAHLESQLNIALFTRVKKRLQLTDAGRTYLHHVTQSLNQLSIGTNELLEHRGIGGQLRIGVLPTIGTRWLIPRLRDFRQKYPTISFEIVTVPADFSLGLMDLDFETLGIDIALFYGQGNWSGMEQTPLAKESLVPVASLKHFDTLQALPTLKTQWQDLPLLMHTTRPTVWQLWTQQYWNIALEPLPIARFEHYYMAIEAALSGLGIALLPSILIETELHGKHLFALPDYPLELPEHYYVLHYAARRDEWKIRVFREWILDRALSLS